VKGIETKGQTGSLQEVSAAAGMHPKLAPAARASYSCFDFVRAGPGVETQRTPGALLGVGGVVAIIRQARSPRSESNPSIGAAAAPPSKHPQLLRLRLRCRRRATTWWRLHSCIASPACLSLLPLLRSQVRARRSNVRCRGRALIGYNYKQGKQALLIVYNNQHIISLYALPI